MRASILSALILLIAACSASPTNPAVADPAPGLPPSVLRACDLIAQIAARAKGVTIKRSTGPFADEFESRTRSGCSVSLVGSTKALGTSPNPIEELRQEFTTRGWQEDVNHSADGPDGTTFAYVHAGVICVFRGQWDGGDDSDPTFKPDDEYTGAGHCAANPPRLLAELAR